MISPRRFASLSAPATRQDSAPQDRGPGLASVDLLASLNDEHLAGLRQAFVRSTFDAKHALAFEAIAGQMLDVVRLPVVWWHLRRETHPSAVLSRVFIYDDPVPRASLAPLLGEPLLAALLGAGVLEAEAGAGALGQAEGEVLSSPYRLTPFEECWILSDPLEAGPDAVMGPGATTYQLDQLLPARAGLSLLDVGCGAGTLALAAARRGAARVVGVDISARAVTLARFNARLNGLAVSFREGDLTAPARGETFDVVVSQPPYVMRPASGGTTTFLHGGPVGDELALRLLAELPPLLAPGGCGVVMFDEALRPGPPLPRRLRALVGDAPVDILVLGASTGSPNMQALAYASLEDPTLGARYHAAVRSYREHLASLQVDEFRRQLVILGAHERGPSRPPYEVLLPVGSFGGASRLEIEGLRAALALAHASPAELLGRSLAIYPGARLQREWEFTGPRENETTGEEQGESAPEENEPVKVSLRFPRGALAQERELDENGAFLLDLLDRGHTVEQVVHAYAEACSARVGDVHDEVLTFVREGLAKRMLVPAPRPA